MPSREQRIKEILLELDAEINEVPSILNSTDCPYTLDTFYKWNGYIISHAFVHKSIFI